MAIPNTRAGGSTPPENYLVLDFNYSADTYADFNIYMPPTYAGGGVTLTLAYMAATATAGNVKWGAAFRRAQDDAEDLDTAHTYDFNTTTVATASATGELDYASITFTDGADMDSLAAGEFAILRIVRQSTGEANATDTDQIQFFSAVAKET